MRHLGPCLAELQEQLYAEGHTGSQRSLLLVLQGMDTAGKGATVEHVLGLVNPMGVRYHGFKKPTLEEREHHFLWRVSVSYRRRGLSGSSTVPTMRTWGWFGYMSSCRRRYGHAATASSIASRRSWWPRAPEW
ncbi:MAG: hypothetical protein ACRDRR_05990 [Pseudonocardiaceae bacterium]